MQVQAEISLYPLGQGEPLAPILEFIETLRSPGLTVEPGPLSTLISGPSEWVFPILQAAYERSAESGRTVLVVKMIHVPQARRVA